MAARFGAAVVLVALTALCSPVAMAQGVTDPGDLAFWQSIQNSTNPAEYKAYLEIYPNGRFAPLARIRMSSPPAPARAGLTAGPAIVAAPAAAPAADDTASEYKILVTPSAVRIGQIVSFDCSGLPQGNSYDQLVVVPSGTPEMAPNRSREDSKVVGAGYVATCPSGPIKLGPFAPGSYEVRWMSTLFNNESRYEMKAKSVFIVR